MPFGKDGKFYRRVRKTWRGRTFSYLQLSQCKLNHIDGACILERLHKLHIIPAEHGIFIDLETYDDPL
jgi:hypothetical protein